jgi:hypothetical protein
MALSPTDGGALRVPIDLGHLRSPRQRMWRGRPLSPLMEVRMFFDDEGPVPETFRGLKKRLDDAGIPHIFIGASAVHVNGHRRSTEDLDLCLRAGDLERFKREFVGSVYQPVAGRPRKFFDPQTQVSFDILIAGEIAGNRRKQREVRFPDPSEAEMHEGAAFPSLARLIELKLVTWRYQDWGDVVNLIRVHNLDESFAGKLHPVARSAYLQCHDQKVEEDRYNPEIDEAPPEEGP